jgi:penicillin amidase
MLRLEGLQDAVRVVRDESGIPHIFAENAADLFFAQGFVHAQDRLFQMDLLRRQAEGTAAELLGPAALAGDVQARTLGIARSGAGVMALLSAEARSALASYAAGVNAFLASGPLPPEYTVLELTSVRPWTAADSISVSRLITFNLSFELNDLQRTAILMAYQRAGAAQGFDGTALFFEDTNRVAPFDPASTVPDAGRDPGDVGLPPPGPRPRASFQGDGAFLRTRTLELVRDVLDELRSVDGKNGLTTLDKGDRGSNEFVVAGSRSTSGAPILANDPHNPLLTPAIFYDNALTAPRAGFDVIGASFPGLPFVAIGHNRDVAWGVTVNPIDLTDVYQEQVVPDPTSPSGLSTVFQGRPEPIVPLPISFRTNVIGDGAQDSLVAVPPSAQIPPVVLIVPRRNNGPIVSLDAANGVALSVQYAGFSASRELDAARSLNLARNLKDFTRAIQNVDVTAQNFAYADTKGNIAYFSTGELPLREDLQAQSIAGLPPFLIRNGQGGNEWIAARSAQPDRSIPFEILPFAETPSIVNPALGFIVNANNDPAGTTLDNDVTHQLRPGGGILYFGVNYDLGIRAGRITRLLEQRLAARGRVSDKDLQEIQADVVLGDAQFFTPIIVQALANAQRPDAPESLRALGADTRIQEAVGRLAAWDRSTPTGIPQGFDASDTPDELRTPDATEIANSVAATLYSTWRTQAIRGVLIANLQARGLPLFTPSGAPLTALRNLFENFAQTGGRGASGIDFFSVPGVDAAPDRRDIVVLTSMATALDRLAGDDFAPAFARSTRQDDYRWGLLHRVVLAHPLGPPFSVPPAGGAFPPPLQNPDGSGLPGIPVDGGLFTVDVANTSLLPANVAQHMFSSGPNRRLVAQTRGGGRGISAVTSLPGGQSGVPGSPFFVNLLREYLTNETHALRLRPQDLGRNASEVFLVPGTAAE